MRVERGDLTIESLINRENYQSPEEIIGLLFRSFESPVFQTIFMKLLLHHADVIPEEEHQEIYNSIEKLLNSTFADPKWSLRKSLKWALSQEQSSEVNLGLLKGRKVLSDVVPPVTESLFGVGDQASPPILKRAIRLAIGVALYQLKDDEGRRVVAQSDNQDIYLAAFLKCDDLFANGKEKISYMDELIGLDPEFIEKAFIVVDKPLVVSAYRVKKIKQDQFGLRARMNILNFIVDNKDILQDNESQEAFLKATGILYEILAEDEVVKLYVLDDCSNEQALLKRLMEVCKRDEVVLNGLFCPDWSGKIENGMWKYDFQNVGEEIGVVATKGIPLLQHLYDTLSRHIGKVEVRLDFPTFECPLNGYYHEETDNFVSREEFARRLVESGQKAKQVMADMGVDMTPGLTSRIFSDEEFQEMKSQMVAGINNGHYPQGFSKQTWDELVEKTYNARKFFYPSWYPQNIGESDSEYKDRMMTEVIPNQLSEYVIFQRAYSEGNPVSIMIGADNQFMSNTIAAIAGYPVITGQSKDALSYLGQ